MFDAYNDEPLGLSTAFEICRYTPDGPRAESTSIATEIPLTIVANDVEVATLMASPSDIKFLCLGFLFSSGFIAKSEDVSDILVNEQKWRVDVTLAKTPTPEVLSKRLYTAGCGKGVMFPSISTVSARMPLSDGFQVPSTDLFKLTDWFLRCSDLHRETHGVHTAAVSLEGKIPTNCFDDVGRHNAVDKVLGDALSQRLDLRRCVLVSTGRVSSEILHKAKRCSIPVVLSLGSPTHQSILLAREMNVTLVCFARRTKFAVFAGQQRIAGQEAPLIKNGHRTAEQNPADAVRFSS